MGLFYLMKERQKLDYKLRNHPDLLKMDDSSFVVSSAQDLDEDITD